MTGTEPQRARKDRSEGKSIAADDPYTNRSNLPGQFARESVRDLILARASIPSDPGLEAISLHVAAEYHLPPAVAHDLVECAARELRWRLAAMFSIENEPPG